MAVLKFMYAVLLTEGFGVYYTAYRVGKEEIVHRAARVSMPHTPIAEHPQFYSRAQRRI